VLRPLAVGLLGLSPDVIDEMVPADLRLALIARYTYDGLHQRQEWEQTRLISYYALAPHVKKGTINEPKDLMKFPWEDSANQKSNKIEDLSEGWKKFIKRHDEKAGIKTSGIE
jgi:hypothetical protein